MKFKKIDGRPDITGIQEEIIKFWKDENIFEKSVNQNKNKEIVFYDGPPFPTGKPHHGTMLVSFIKDMISRYWTMRGFSVPRQWGWDCHGLPIETQAEAKMGIKFKSEIESTYGVDNFNHCCHDIVSTNNDTWKNYVDEMARWVDYDGAYKTMDKNFMESVIWAFKQCYDKGLIYKDYKVAPYCFRCQTSLSISDTRESDSTRPKQDNWVIAKFKTNEFEQNLPVCFLAWTTTPWTLPSNMALAVGENIDYVYIKVESEIFVVCKSSLSRYSKVFGENPEIIKECKGTDLVGKTYVPIFDYFKTLSQNGAFRVISADYVDPNDGIGIVHIAPAFGEDDYWACKKSNVPLVNPVDEKGNFTDEVTDFAGRNVMEANRDVIRYLKSLNKIVSDGTLEHNYPHCWRCRTPLIYKAMEAWYFSVDKVKERLIELNEKINWIPDVVKYGRFGNWLENARDWNISRNRYWSTPLPVWQCDKCGKYHVLGSIEEIYKVSGIKLTDLHKHHMDKVTFDCECGGTMKRIPEVLDCWFESGSVPFARLHYPFENKDWFDKHTTSDFVVEYTGQIRCWFYYLLVLSGALFDKEPFKNCIVHGTVLAKDGKKLSKSSKNYTDPMELMKKYGTDAFRLYMYQSNAILLGDLQFDENGILESLQSIILPFWNACSFFLSYAEIDGMDFDENIDVTPKNQLDSWLLALLFDTQKTVIENMDKYQINNYVEPVKALIDGLTNWYIRGSRRRFWAKENTEDKISAYKTLYFTLVNTCKLLAPITPIIAEELYKKLTDKDSVHLSKLSLIDEKFKNDDLLKEIDTVQKIIHIARSLRTKNNIKNRQPLNSMEVCLSDKKDAEIVEKYKDVICEELNVKLCTVIENIEEIATVIYKPNFNVIKENNKDLLPAVINAVRNKNFKIKGENVSFLIDGNEVLMTKDALLVEYLPKHGENLIGEDGIVVAVDLTITAELKKEGIAREIVRTIQDIRKTLDCNIMDRIYVHYSGDVPEDWKNYISNETLSDLKEFENADSQAEIAGTNIIVYVKKK